AAVVQAEGGRRRGAGERDRGELVAGQQEAVGHAVRGGEEAGDESGQVDAGGGDVRARVTGLDDAGELAGHGVVAVAAVKALLVGVEPDRDAVTVDSQKLVNRR